MCAVGPYSCRARASTGHPRVYFELKIALGALKAAPKMLAARCGVAALQRVPASALPRACAARLSTQAATHDGEFKGRVAVVTGGAVGIGRGICEAWARAGGIVVCGDIDTQAAKELKEASADYPGEVHVREFDASVEDQCLELVDGAAAEFGRLDALVNNVGVQADDGTGVHCLDTATWHKVLAVNLTSYFLCSRAALGHFLPAKSGAIVNMASVQGLQSQSGIPAYAASKGAVVRRARRCARPGSVVVART